MKVDSLDALLKRLGGGDAAAAQEAFVAYEPVLRQVVRRQLPPQLRPKFDSVDVVQSVWADVLHGCSESGWRFRDVGHLRAFLVTMTRNRFIDRLRQHQAAVAHEQPLEDTAPNVLPPSREPRPSETVQADELWEQMLAMSPPAHHELLRLKRQGYSTREVADRTGLHEDSVHRILRNLARQITLTDKPIATTPDHTV
jgi:RNA polymerase sigma-70 factor (ECF subfamily)